MDSTEYLIIAGDQVTSVAVDTITPSDLGCDVCSNILGIFNTPFNKEHSIALGRVKDLLTHECPHTDWVRNIKYMYGSVPRYESRELDIYKWANSRDAFFGLNYLTKGSSVWSTSQSFEWVFRPEVPNHQGTARILDGCWIDLDLVKDWRSRCICNHSDKCEESTIRSMTSFNPQWLVDVVEGCVVPCVEEKPRFVTLSYTWGQTENFRATKSIIEEIQKPGALRSGLIASQIPQTIHDAIELTKALGETRLWIDSLCIIQDDEVALAHELKHMHLIYANSCLTIIAEDGQDAEYGLRGLKGISSARSIKQLVVSLAGGERIAMMSDAFDRPKPSMFDYDKRMWTFQERVFAKRRLIFASGSVKWQCNCAEWSEHRMYHLEADGFSIAPELIHINRGIQSRIPSPFNLSEVVREFNQKTLSFDEDVFNAFSGLHTHMNDIFPSGLVFGLPELFFDISLCWHPNRNLRRRKISQNYTEDPIYNRLPSWSWMGWQGEICFPWDLEYQQTASLDEGFTEAITKWYAVQSPGSTRKRLVDSTWDQHRKTAPQHIPDGWTCVEFKPPAEWKSNGDEDEIKMHFMPKELPNYTYSHGSKEDNPLDSQWYPVPIQDTFSANDKETELHREYQYLRCETSRAYLFGSPETASSNHMDYIHLIKDGNGSIIGGLRLHHKGDSQLLEKEITVELIAVAKGWSSMLKRYTVGKHESYVWPENDVQLTEEEEKEEEEKNFNDDWTKESKVTPWMEQWEHEKTQKQNCYHVLWIEWENGVAYRKASGFVLEDKWEQLAEPGTVDIILG